ncbi:unnamed protein product [Spirodela intermedia]|uniref:Reverse transcriptase Ty1/copia-type domain-containing protein n=2 Tax=Spirodela intermedia TaxID=51605 RepID=A0A7I8JIS6_SPIIN|nr:unnamed protein product [Spirodela intermedia]CAA6669423.1 unnamed protein product [Spirodela intermedia]CAA7406378.1 unnamed protein product [Spirodela intermedia]
MCDLGLLTSYLGIEVEQFGDMISLKQQRYALRILDHSGMQDCNPTATPLEAWFKFNNGVKSQSVDPTKFQSIIGSLRYLVHTT